MNKAANYETGIIKFAVKSNLFTQVQRRVTLKLKDGTRAVIDGLAENADGTYTLIEAKMGGGKLSKGQRKVLAAIMNGEEVIGVGKNAKAILKNNTGKDISKKINKNMLLNKDSKSVGTVLKER
jgi:hypothetical protein